jgi:hypothetical protein
VGANRHSPAQPGRLAYRADDYAVAAGVNGNLFVTLVADVHTIAKLVILSAADCYFALSQKSFKYQKSPLSGCPKLNIVPYVK